jgi:hypothetical protein
MLLGVQFHVLKHHSAFTFKVKQFKKMAAPQPFKMLKNYLPSD